MKENTNYFRVNKDTWNKKVGIHAESEMYKMDAFKSGETSLMPNELKAYILYLEKALEVPITVVSIGPDRSQTILK